MTPVPLWWLLVDEYGAQLDAGECQTAYQDMDAYLEIVPDIYRAQFLTWPAVAARYVGDTDRADTVISEARQLIPGISISDIRPFDLPYTNPAIPKRRYVVLRELGLSD